MKIEFNTIIKTNSDLNVRFFKSVKYLSSMGIEVIIDRHDKDSSLIVKSIIETTNIIEALFLVELEMVRLTNLLSWNIQIPILGFKITGYQNSETNDNQNAVVLADLIKLSDHISIEKTLGLDSIELLEQSLTREFDDNLLDIMSRWKEAIKQTSTIAKFFLLYRILEELLGDRQAVDKWIIKNDSEIEQRESKKRMVTIYTYLRDNIHPKMENLSFPFKEVDSAVNGLQKLVQKSIVEKFPDASFIIF